MCDRLWINLWFPDSRNVFLQLKKIKKTHFVILWSCSVLELDDTIITSLPKLFMPVKKL